ncbi:VWA domain-containing protein [uncultured Winogradskyella sp.]|uniref:vWA domain-containing protein n=1 Tax=uncultured Winogradskyella sp. TaxID=395353 RepID=UPI002619F942|nr:VWA domain-containing protein [uncultured Winogradskyella sp.]
MKVKPFKSVIKFSIGLAVVLLVSACHNPNESKNTIYSVEEVELYNVAADEEVVIDHNTEEYDRIYENAFKEAKQNPLSTFSIDVDNASYSNVRRFLNNNQLPPKDAVRIEEMINYFNYDYPQPTDKHPFSFSNEVADCPWNTEHKLVHIGIQGKSLDYNDLKPSNFVFLIDASGSMSSNDKLPLLKKGLKLLLSELNENDKVAIVAYAGSAGLVLPSTKASKKEKIIRALDRIESGGSTAGGQGIQLAYNIAKENLIANGNNRVILATDGDFNVGMSSSSELVRLIEEKRKEDIYLTICGFGMGNYKDGRMEQISNAGNGNYFYIDNIKEAKKVFSTDMRTNMFTIAKDVKIQIEFNPKQVKAYRLIGYENRLMNDEDFNDDKKDAGELGAGHTVTALYEVVLSNSTENISKHDPLKYQKTESTRASKTDELLTIKFRYKKPKQDESILITNTIVDEGVKLELTSNNFRFSSAVAGFGLLLRDSNYKGNITYAMVEELASKAKGDDINGYRQDFINMLETSSLLAEKY